MQSQYGQPLRSQYSLTSDQVATRAEVTRQMKENSEYTSTTASIWLSVINSLLHLSVAFYVSANYPGDHYLFWAFMVLSAMANLVAMILYIAKSVGPDVAIVGIPTKPSEISLKLQEHPNESMWCLMLAVINTESLCFLTTSEESHEAFRKMSIIGAVVEDFPLMLLIIFNMLEHGFLQFLMLSSFMVTLFHLCIKVYRVIIIVATQGVTTPAKKPFFSNLRNEDYLLVPFALMNWALLFVLLFFLQGAAYEGGFAQRWVTAQLLTLGGNNDTNALFACLADGVNTSATHLDWLTATANTQLNLTETEPLTVDSLVRGVVMPNGVVDGPVTELAARLLTPGASSLLSEWTSLQDLISTSFVWGAIFFWGGAFATLVLFISYLRLPQHADSFRTELMWRSSFMTSVIALCAATCPSLLNCVSQDDKGYSTVRRDSAIITLCFYGVPMISVAWAVLRGFDCQHRSCHVPWRGQTVEYYTIFMIVIAVPLVWWQSLSLLTSVVSMRSTESSAKGGRKSQSQPLPTEQAAIDRLEPPTSDAGQSSAMTSLLAGCSFSALVWLLQLFLILSFWWNSPLSVYMIGGRPAHEWGTQLATQPYDRPIDYGSSAPTGYWEPAWVEGNFSHPPLPPPRPPTPSPPPSCPSLPPSPAPLLPPGNYNASVPPPPTPPPLPSSPPLPPLWPCELLIDGQCHNRTSNWTDVWVAYETPLPWRPKLPSSYFEYGLGFWVCGMLINVLAVGSYIAQYATRSLRKAIEEKLAMTAAAFTFSLITPDAMRVLADRRKDVNTLRKLCVLPALFLDVPVIWNCIIITLDYGIYSYVMWTMVLSVLHMLLFSYRALVVWLTEDLRRPPLPPEQRTAGLNGSDLGTLVATLFHMGLMCFVMVLYYYGSYYGVMDDFVDDQGNRMDSSHVDGLYFAFQTLVVFVSLLLAANLALSVSCLNHWNFANVTVSENSYKSAFVLLLSTLDASFLNLLAEDELAIAEVKRAATYVSLGLFFGPSLVMQVAMVFMINIDWSVYQSQQADRGLIAAAPVQNSGLAFTVLIGIWKMMRLTILQASHKEAINQGIVLPFKHAMIGSAEWTTNRSPPEGWVEEGVGAPEADGWGFTVTGARHHYGYAIGEDGNYVLDLEGNYALADGVSYQLDDNGDYAIDAEGNYILDGLMPSVQSTSSTHDVYNDNVTNTSRSTDTFADQYNLQHDPTAGFADAAVAGGGGAAAMVETKCSQNSIFMTPDGYQGVFVAVTPTYEQPQPFLFIKAYEISPIKRSRFGRAAQQQVSFKYLSAEAGGYDQSYVEANISKDPEAAYRSLEGGDAPADADANAFDASEFPLEGFGADAAGYADVPLTPDSASDASLAQRL